MDKWTNGQNATTNTGEGGKKEKKIERKKKPSRKKRGKENGEEPIE